jgi:hypothetical protein
MQPLAILQACSRTQRARRPGFRRDRASAARLAEAYDRLSEDERDRPVPTRIWHEGQIVRDSPCRSAS